jgi:3-oxoacyl-[acyl-carrier protein] reductase
MSIRSEFENKGVVITGAAGVFGRWIAATFAREGAKLCLSDMRLDALEALAGELGLDHSRTVLHRTELTDEASILDLAASVKAAWGAPDILINNAGVYPKAGLLGLQAAEWDRIFSVNLRAPFLLSREFANLMIGASVKGSIINISSGASRQMRNGSVPYCTSKTALERLTKGFALELAPYGIRVNAVEPGFAPGSAVSPLSGDYVQRMTARIPLGRTSGPDDAPQAILFLASSQASFVTGAVLSVDGGNSIGTYESGQLGPAPGTVAV